MKSKRIAAFVAAAMLLTASVTAHGLGIQHVSMSSSLFSNSIQAGFSESSKGTGSYGTNKSKVIKQCYVRLKEGDYDSGRVSSAVGKRTGGGKYIWTKEVSRANNPFKTCYTNYGWLYY